MICPRCGVENGPPARFCVGCGTALPAVCPSCGFANQTPGPFCGGCGHALAPAGSAPGPERAPRAYTPKHLAERILTSRHAMEGERKPVTVLFCDLVDSSRLAAQLEPEVMHEIMDQVLRLMAEAVHRYEGTVNQFLGDGLMALFGAPIALEDHALRAVQAALAIQETVTGYGARLQRERGVNLQLRVGVHTGPVVVGRIGDDLRMDYTAIGDTTHLASRLQALAEPGTIVASDTTHRAVAGYVRSEPLGPVDVKGRPDPIPVFRITGRRQRRSRLEVRIERGLTPLVGREQALQQLRRCWERARAGNGQLVGLVGEAGVGKSRLLFELRQALGNEPVTWREGHCSSYGQGTPYLPLLEIIRASFLIEDGDHPLQMEEKVRRGILDLDMNPDDILPHLQELLPLPGAADHPVRHLDPQTKRRRTFEAIRALTIGAARKRPLVLAIEDLHWADRTTQDYLASLAPSVPGVPILVVTTQRPEHAMPWAAQSWYTQLALDTLGDREVEEMLAALLGSSALPEAMVRSVIEKAEGNPLSVEEIAVSLVERKLVVREEGGLRWSGDVTVHFPGTIQDIVRARIDRLDGPVKDTIQNASAIGRRFSPRLLAAIVDRADEVEPHLAALKQLELVYETRLLPEPELAFKHAVIQDVAYQGMLARRRADLHGAIGEAIERLYPDQLEEQAAVLVHHYRGAGRPEKIVQHGLVAGDRAARLHATAEAKSHYEEALAAVRALPASPDMQRTEIDAILKLAAVGGTRQDIDRDRANLTRARALAEALGDEPRSARVLYWLGRLEYVLWNPRAAIEYASRSLEIGERLGDDAVVAPPVNLLGRIYWIQSDYVRAARMLERNVEQMRRLGNKGEESTAAATAGCVFGLMGEFERALPFADQGVLLAEEIRNPFAEAAAYQQRAIIFDQRGDWARALADYSAARAVAERAGDLFRVFVLKSWEGRARTMTGDVAAGRALIEEGLQLAAQIGTRLILGWQKTFLAACHLAGGDRAAAAGMAEEAIQAARDTGDLVPIALASRTLAEALGGGGPERERADALMLEAMRILEDVQARPELARTYTSYAALQAGAGRHDLAAPYLTKGIEMLDAMGMRWDAERARALASV